MHTEQTRNAFQTDGVIAGSARVLRELIRTPRLAHTIRIVLSHLDPESAPELVRAILFQESALVFDLISAAPALVNAVVLGVGEGCRQLLGIPDTLRQRFLQRVCSEVSVGHLGESAGLLLAAAVRLARPLNDLSDENIRGITAEFQRGLERALGQTGVNGNFLAESCAAMLIKAADRFANGVGAAAAVDNSALARFVNTMAEGIPHIALKNPEFVSKILRPLVHACSQALKE